MFNHRPDGLAPHQNSGVSRTRRASFAFLSLALAWAGIMAIAHWHWPVDPSISTKALDVLGSIGTFVGVAYIGGSVVDYSGILSGIGGKFGINIPTPHQDDCPPDGGNGG
jgi:hypothetical protein